MLIKFYLKNKTPQNFNSQNWKTIWEWWDSISHVHVYESVCDYLKALSQTTPPSHALTLSIFATPKTKVARCLLYHNLLDTMIN